MSKTHTGEVTKVAKRVASWLADKARGAGKPTSQSELRARVEAICPKNFSEDDRDAVESASLVFFKRADPVGHAAVTEKWITE